MGVSGSTSDAQAVSSMYMAYICMCLDIMSIAANYILHLTYGRTGSHPEIALLQNAIVSKGAAVVCSLASQLATKDRDGAKGLAGILRHMHHHDSTW